MRFQRRGVGFHVCHLPESSLRRTLVLPDVITQKSCGARLYPLSEAQFGGNAKFDKSYWILKNKCHSWVLIQNGGRKFARRTKSNNV